MGWGGCPPSRSDRGSLSGWPRHSLAITGKFFFWNCPRPFVKRYGRRGPRLVALLCHVTLTRLGNVDCLTTAVHPRPCEP